MGDIHPLNFAVFLSKTKKNKNGFQRVIEQKPLIIKRQFY